ncbi:MAG: hypothetical protein ABEJ75_02470 [Candidatus Nanohaloarchaea archaeon]
MRELYFNAGTGTGVLSAVFAGLAINQGYSLLAALLALGSLAAITYTESRSRQEGRDRQEKFLITFSAIFYEVVMLVGLLVTEPVSIHLAVLVLAVIFASEALSLELLQEMQQNFELALGSEIRVIAVAVTFFASYFNPAYLYWGTLLVGLIAFYDFGDILRQVYTEI